MTTQQIVPMDELLSFTKLMISGPFGAGKTTLAQERIQWLLKLEGVRGDDILILVPQRTLAQSYYDILRGPDSPPGPLPRIATTSALSRSALELYWPLVAERADFDNPAKEPTFLNLETSQYHMANFVDKAIGEAKFDGIRIERSRIISQVLDNMNKAALQGLTIDEVYQRLELAIPSGEQRVARLNALNAAKEISQQFRQLCLQETLLDFSLQTTLFNEHVLNNEWSRTHLFRNHRHLIVDNAEEDNYTTHQFVTQWLPQLESALILVDTDAGYRLFLGADPKGVDGLYTECEKSHLLVNSYVVPPQLHRLAHQIDQIIVGPSVAKQYSNVNDSLSQPETDVAADIADKSQEDTDGHLHITHGAEPIAEQGLRDILHIPNASFRFYPQMIDWVIGEVRSLILDQGVPADQIVLLAPFVSDALRFSLQTGLERHNIALATHRPSRALQNEPAARALITLAKLAHPEWGIQPEPNDVTVTLTVAISQLDPVRASLLSQIVFPPRNRTIELGRFGALIPAMQQRISYVVGERYDNLRDWIAQYRASADPLPLDQFFARLFGEVLSQEGYGFHRDHDAARIANQLVESSKNFRWSLQSHDHQQTMQGVGLEYILLLESGALGALFAPGWKEVEDAVFLAPAYTFIMRNRAVDVQFWLDIGSGGWWDRLFQPLTHPHVLSHRWPVDQLWTDIDEEKTRKDTLRRLLLGLVRRTRQSIYLSLSDYSESGFEQRGPLLGVINRLLAQQE